MSEWSKTPPDAEQVRACAWWWVRGASEAGSMEEPSRFRVADEMWIEVQDGVGDWWDPRELFTDFDRCEFAPALKPSEVASRDAEIARLNALVERARSLATVRGGDEDRAAADKIRERHRNHAGSDDMLILWLHGAYNEAGQQVNEARTEIARLNERVSTLESQCAAMGAALAPFAGMARHFDDPKRGKRHDGDPVFAVRYFVEEEPSEITVSDLRACQPHALPAAAAVIRAAHDRVRELNLMAFSRWTMADNALVNAVAAYRAALDGKVTT